MNNEQQNNDRSALAAIIVAIASLVLMIAVVIGDFANRPTHAPAPDGNIEARAVERASLLCATESGNCVESWNGSDFIIYSGAGSSQTYHVDGATGNVDAEGTANFASDATLGADVIVSAQTAISVTNGSAITATGTYQPLESAAEVTATVAILPAGTFLYLTNTANTTINIQDTGIQKLSAAMALTQYDSLVLWSDGTNWIEVSRSTN